MQERRVYRNPPIEEALCEFRFTSGRPWDVAIGDRLQSALGDEYGGAVRVQQQVDLGITVEVRTAPAVKAAGAGTAVQLANAAGTRLVGVGDNALRVHMLKPYQDKEARGPVGWDEFRPRIVRALEAYWQVAEPEGVHRVGVRYVNKIVVPETRVRIEDYLPYALPEVEVLPDTVSNFVTRVEYTYEDGVRLILSQGTVASPLDHAAMLLDIDCIHDVGLVGRSRALEIADELRTRERNAFEAVITDGARRLFDAI